MIPSQLFGSPLRPPWVLLGSPTGLTDASLAPSTNCIALCQLWEPIRDPQLMMSSWSWPCATSKNLLGGCNGWSIDGREPTVKIPWRIVTDITMGGAFPEQLSHTVPSHTITIKINGETRYCSKLMTPSSPTNSTCCAPTWKPWTKLLQPLRWSTNSWPRCWAKEPCCPAQSKSLDLLTISLLHPWIWLWLKETLKTPS